mmetsp:Transcript_8198/g.24602  ORF Transcript_8198/g.24602 Transcript_8198/m.24602 type:complete len:205 (-) Transcript_8198:868-1482(-)
MGVLVPQRDTVCEELVCRGSERDDHRLEDEALHGLEVLHRHAGFLFGFGVHEGGAGPGAGQDGRHVGWKGRVLDMEREVAANGGCRANLLRGHLRDVGRQGGALDPARVRQGLDGVPESRQAPELNAIGVLLHKVELLDPRDVDQKCLGGRGGGTGVVTAPSGIVVVLLHAPYSSVGSDDLVGRGRRGHQVAELRKSGRLGPGC